MSVQLSALALLPNRMCRDEPHSVSVVKCTLLPPVSLCAHCTWAACARSADPTYSATVRLASWLLYLRAACSTSSTSCSDGSASSRPSAFWCSYIALLQACGPMTALCSGAWGHAELQQLEPPALRVSGQGTGAGAMHARCCSTNECCCHPCSPHSVEWAGFLPSAIIGDDTCVRIKQFVVMVWHNRLLAMHFGSSVADSLSCCFTAAARRGRVATMLTPARPPWPHTHCWQQGSIQLRSSTWPAAVRGTASCGGVLQQHVLPCVAH
jgi:hypothetical protein